MAVKQLPKISDLPEPPDRLVGDQERFDVLTFNSLKAQKKMVNEDLNKALIPALNEFAVDVNASVDAAALSERNAHDSEEVAKRKADEASGSAGAAKVSEDNAKVSETNALASKNAAASSATAAQNAKVAAEAARDEAQDLANVGPATTAKLGLVKTDGKTTQADAGGTITVKDVAIGGTLGDLASARGQVGDARQLADLDFNMLTVPGFYRTTGNPQNGPIGISGASIGSLFVSGMQGNGNRLFQIMVSGNGIYWRTSISGGTTWEIWNQVLTGNKIGDGIRNTNGIISVPEMQGATSAQAGVSGLVPPPLAADAGKVLGADGTWSFPKDVAIGGDLEDLASARGQIGDNIRINTASDLNAYTKAGNWLFSDAAAGENFPNIGRGGELNCYVSTTAIFQFFTEFNNNRRYIRYGIPNSTWTNWIQFISVAQLGDGIRNTNGIISVPEYEGATVSAAGTSGLVPPAAAGQQESFLTGGGEYKPALTKISDSVSLADSTTAASAKAVKAAYDLANGKQAALGFTPVQQGGGANQYASKIYLGWDGGAVRVQVDGSDMGQLVTTLAGQQKAPNAAWADGAQFALRLRREGNVDTIWDWAGQGGQPGWLWGGNDGVNMYVYNPANFSVNYANSAYMSTAVSGVWFGRNNQTVPSGGTWRVITSINGKIDFMTVAGGTSIPHDWWYAVRVA